MAMSAHVNPIGQMLLLVAIIPYEIHAKYAVSSKGERTGLRKRTMDSAPTNPRDRAMLVLMTDTIPHVIIGNINKVVTACLDLMKLILLIVSAAIVIALHPRRTTRVTI